MLYVEQMIKSAHKKIVVSIYDTYDNNLGINPSNSEKIFENHPNPVILVFIG